MRTTQSRQFQRPIPFPRHLVNPQPKSVSRPELPSLEAAEETLAAIDCMSRKIEDLARELNCLGYFDDDDRPRAA